MINTLTQSPEGQDFKIKRVVNAPHERVFNAITKPELISQWLGCDDSVVHECAVEPKIGGKMHISMDGKGESCVITGKVLAYDPPKYFSFSWSNNHSFTRDLPETTVEFYLTEDGDSTEVELIHRGLPEGEAQTGHNQGWNSSLNKLAALVEDKA